MRAERAPAYVSDWSARDGRDCDTSEASREKATLAGLHTLSAGIADSIMFGIKRRSARQEPRGLRGAARGRQPARSSSPIDLASDATGTRSVRSSYLRWPRLTM